MKLKKSLSVLLALVMILSVFSGCGKKAAPAATEAAPAETTAATEAPVVAETEAPELETVSDGYYHVGDKIDDFTITTCNGKEISLYKVLEEKDMVLLNLWAIYCDPCAAEFPAMQEAYEQYQDKVEIIALSTDPSDSDEALAKYVHEKGMTFPVTRDTVDLRRRIHSSSIPISIVVDRFGIICAIQSGNATDPAIFTNVFDIFTAEDYTESIFMPNLHAKLPDVQPSDPAQLNAALNVEGGNLVFTNSPDRFYWPMIVEKKDGRTVASASNVDMPYSHAVLETQVDAKAGDVLVIEYKFDCVQHLSVMRVTVDGKDVLVSNMIQDWTVFPYQFEKSGTHKISVRFERNLDENEGGEGLWIDSIRLTTGDEVAEILAKKPQYPVSKEFRMELMNENAEPYVRYMDEYDYVLDGIHYVCPDPVLQFEIELDETMNPETAYVMNVFDDMYPLTSYAREDKYVVNIPIEDPFRFDNISAWLYCDGVMVKTFSLFASVEQVETYAAKLGEILECSLKMIPWNGAEASAQEPEGDGTYTVTYMDQNGDPVPGVMCQVCDASTCQVFVSDADGICQFTLSPGYYEIHTLKVPEGYEGDTTTITEAPLNGGELSFSLIKK